MQFLSVRRGADLSKVYFFICLYDDGVRACLSARACDIITIKSPHACPDREMHEKGCKEKEGKMIKRLF